MNTFEYTTCGTTYKVGISKKRFATAQDHYRYDLYDQEDGSPVATVNVNLPALMDGEIGVKDWSENEGMLSFLVSNKLVDPPHRWIQSGYVQVPVCNVTGLQSLEL